MKAIILAAGRGSRMKHATDNIPKCLLKVKEKTLLEIQIEALKKAGIKEIGIVTGYLSEQLRDYCENTFYNDKWNETNMVFSLMSAQNWLRQSDCVVSYSDIYYDDSIVKKLTLQNKICFLEKTKILKDTTHLDTLCLIR